MIHHVTFVYLITWWALVLCWGYIEWGLKPHYFYHSHWMSLWRMIYSLFLTVLNLQPRGQNGLPVWFMRLAAPWIANPVSYIYNLSCNTSVVPAQWKFNSITPVPKINKPVHCADFRPISVTSVLSRIFERHIVRRDMYQMLAHPDFSHLFNDQFAFRPTASPHSQSQKPQICPLDSFRLF